MKDTVQVLVRKLAQSQVYQDYERAFSEAMGLPLALRPAETGQIVQRGKKHENPFCAIVADSKRVCESCLEVQRKIADSRQGQPRTMACFAGLTDSAVPLQTGKDIFAFLQTGQVALAHPTRAQFKDVARQLLEWGVKTDMQQLETAYLRSPVFSPSQYDAMLRLLEIFARHLSMMSNQLVVQQEQTDTPMIRQAKEFIDQHKNENLSLGDAARSVKVSVFHFCKMFKKVTGLSFTAYLSRVRVEAAKDMLLNPNLRISEIAYQVGFQSLTHFNRVFHTITGRSPTEYRKNLPVLRRR